MTTPAALRRRIRRHRILSFATCAAVLVLVASASLPPTIAIAGTTGTTSVQGDDQWLPFGTQFVGNYISCMAEYQGRLFVGGSFSSAGGIPTPRIAVWNGAAWDSVGGGLDGVANAMIVYNGSLYVGGAFSHAGGVPAANVARWDGAWHAVGGGLLGGGNSVSDLAVHNSTLYAVGSFNQTGASAFANLGLACWDGATWLDGGEYFGFNGLGRAASYNGELYVTGYFNVTGSVQYLARCSPPVVRSSS